MKQVGRLTAAMAIAGMIASAMILGTGPLEAKGMCGPRFRAREAALSVSGPPAPTALAPANGAQVTVPFTISWSAVSDPSGIVAYNWQVSPSSSFSPVILQNSTNGPTQDTVSGLANGTYFWRVQAVNGAFVQGAWSAARSFTVTGPGPGSPGTPSLDPTVGYSTFHPFEVIHVNWSAVPGAATYVLEAATDRSFPVATRTLFDNIPDTTFAFAIGNPEGNYFARVRAVSAAGIAGVPSNVIAFSVFFNNPIGPPPSPVSPLNNPTLTLPVTLTWADVPNPQPSGYEVQIAKDSKFTTIEEDDPQLNGPSRTVLSLTSGPKFWRARSAQGNASPTTAALTAWSATGTFTISGAPATPVSVALAKDPLFSGETTWAQLQLTAAVPAGGASIALSSSNPGALPIPPSVTMQGNIAWMQFQAQAGQVVSSTPVTITAKLNGGSASGQFTVMPPSLNSLSLPSTVSGGTSTAGIVMLNGQAPSSGAAVSLSSNSQAVNPPSTVTVAPGDSSVSFLLSTSLVAQSTPATVTADWKGTTVQAPITVMPGSGPTSLTLFPSTVVGGGPGSVDGTVTIAFAVAFDQLFQVTSSNPAVTPFLASGVTVPAGSTQGLIQILPAAVSTPTIVTISVTGGGVTRSADLTVNPSATPPPPSTLSSFSVSPTSVAGGNPATGTVTLPSAAPSGGTVVTLGSNLPGAASVPPSVTVQAGSTIATFTVTTFPSTGTTVQLSAQLVDSILFAALGVTPPAVSLQSLTLNPTQVSGGSPSTGAVGLSGAAPSGGLVVALASGNPSVAGIPASVTVPQGAASASFTGTTTPVSVSTIVNISATYSGLTKTATLTVMPPATADTVAITLAEYRTSKTLLSVQATSTSATATVKAYVTATGQLIGTLANNGGGKYSGQFSWPSNPQNVTVRSSLGGSATKAVTAK